jgi:hypothetical protein
MKETKKETLAIALNELDSPGPTPDEVRRLTYELLIASRKMLH